MADKRENRDRQTMNEDIRDVHDMSTEARELALTIENDAAYYFAYFMPMARNLERRWRKGTFELTRGIKGMRHGVDQAARRYNLEHGSMSTPWHKIFSVSDRNDVAEYLVRFLVDEWRAGNSYLPVKGQGK